MELYRNFDVFLDELDKFIGVVGLQKPRHVLDADRMCAHLFELLCIGRKAFARMHGTCRVADCGLHMSAFLDGRGDCGF